MPIQISHLPLNEILLRLSLAFLAGLILGYEREKRGRAAGLRTTMLTCVASCLAMLLSHYFAVEYAASADASWRPDPGRLGAGILTGIGFLGAGTIVRQNGSVRGLTTAAVLWYATILGLIFGGGFLSLGLIGCVLAMLALFLLPHFEIYIESAQHAVIWITLQLDNQAEPAIRRQLEAEGVEIERVLVDVDASAGQMTLRYAVRYDKSTPSEIPVNISRALTQHPGIVRVRWR